VNLVKQPTRSVTEGTIETRANSNVTLNPPKSSKKSDNKKVTAMTTQPPVVIEHPSEKVQDIQVLTPPAPPSNPISVLPSPSASASSSGAPDHLPLDAAMPDNREESSTDPEGLSPLGSH
jgi:hypothetical protein